jgi:hypothetical protein
MLTPAAADQNTIEQLEDSQRPKASGRVPAQGQTPIADWKRYRQHKEWHQPQHYYPTKSCGF